MISQGLAYMDDTDAETMAKQRMERQPSYRRNSNPEENLEIFEKLLKGDTSVANYCMRAKIDYESVNGTLRDPVMYRGNDLPHHRTKTKYKAYPTYGFACPIVDSIEGVTHALRTTEYNDQNVQYEWLQNAMKLRKVYIQTFGKVNFINTVLSKRKLNWFVNENLVEGWFDPRFPTIQGCIRRGVMVEALRAFIIYQGASKHNINMEWDKFWSDNKKILEEKSARYMGIVKASSVPFIVSNYTTPGITQIIDTQIHPQKPEMGTRILRRSQQLLIERDDVGLFKVGDEVTLLRWGNFKIESININNDTNTVTSVTGSYLPDAKNFSKTKKLSWLADVDENIEAELVEFDHLITKKTLGDEDDFKDYVNPVTKASQIAKVDACCRLLKAGDVIQLERRGFYRVDAAYGGDNSKPLQLFNVPDGKTRAMSTLSSALAHR